MAINLKPTEAMAAEAKLGLEWRAEFNRGGTAVGVARARDISNRVNLSEETIGRMVSFFARHEVDKQGQGFSPGEEGYPSAGRIAWALWGGDPGASWARARQRELDTDNNFMQIEINNRLGKVKLNSGVNKDSADDLIDKLDKLYGSRAVAAQMCIGEIVCKADDAIDGIEIEINTPGGSVFEGQRIYNALREMSARGVEITATVNGLAASMGSVILMAGDKRRMTAGSRVMIHEASTIAAGDARALKKQAELLESISAEIAGIYSERTGMDEEEIREMMMAETWMTADEAKEKGFVDVVLKDGKEVAQFDTAAKSMSILSKLFPGNDEAAKIEAAIAENDTLRADLTTAQALIAELSGHAEVIAQLRAELATEQETAVETIEKVKELETKVEKLEEQIEVSDDKVNVRAAELLASTGHPAPVALAGDNNEAPVSHLKAMASMKPLEAAEYFALHKAEILSDKNRYAV
jgi:ATP-dependent Clp endopeptidase proteolytic subunit ClpP